MTDIKIKARKTEYIDVEISARELHDKSVSLVRRKVVPTDLPADAYINSDGKWEDWEAGHGSGYTTTHRAATAEEAKAFQIILDFEKLTR